MVAMFVKLLNAHCLATALLLSLGSLTSTVHAAGEFEGCHWIWNAPQAKDGEVVYFRQSFRFEQDVKIAGLAAAADDSVDVFVNGERVLQLNNVKNPEKTLISDLLGPGENVIAARVKNNQGSAGFLLRADFGLADGSVVSLVSNSGWKTTDDPAEGWNQAGHDVSKWSPVYALGPYGTQPWGHLPDPILPVATPAKAIQVLPGFKVELLYTVPRGYQGSWVHLTVDPAGRLIAADQYGGIYRVTPPPIGAASGQVPVERLDLGLEGAHGLLYAFDSLYVMINEGDPSKCGLYRARDTNGDDQFDSVKQLRHIEGGGEHGAHTIVSNGTSLFAIFGNHTKLSTMDSTRVPRKWDEDFLLTRQWDGQGHARGVLAPGGWICRLEPDQDSWELYSIGYRNAFDLAFSPEGELFTFDADMEWDMGMPWYRPTRICHVVSGSEFGWRSGSAKFPEYFPDNLPATLNIGPGSPSGVLFGTGAKFPVRYQRALFALDWTFGTLYAVHLEPDGASYRATREEFLAGKPLPLTDAVIGKDGAFYFTIGGRGNQSGLYRVTYIGDEPTAPAGPLANDSGRGLRRLRHRLESFHARLDPDAVDFSWRFLSHKDRFIRYAARVAIEHQNVSSWQDRALQEPNPLARLEALVALARQGDFSLRPRVLASLLELDFKALDEDMQLALLRAYSLTFIRMGSPDVEISRKIVRYLDDFYPHTHPFLNRELCRVLVYLESPTVIDKTLALLGTSQISVDDSYRNILTREDGYAKRILAMFDDMPPAQDLHYLFVLRNLRYGWTLEQRQNYFSWVDKLSSKPGGASYDEFLENIKKEALANASPDERAQLAALSGGGSGSPPPPPEIPDPIGPGKEWSLAEILSLVGNGLSGRDFDKGQRAYAASRCASCHRFLGRGGSLGPDLTNAAGRFGYRELLESILEPSKVISDQYGSTIVVTAQGDAHVGRIVSETDDALEISTDPFEPDTLTKISKSAVVSRRPSPTSSMPEKLIDVLNEDEVLDLLAYILSRGDRRDPSFK